MTTRYRQLQPEERVTIAALRLQNRANSKVPGNNCSDSTTGRKQGWLATVR